MRAMEICINASMRLPVDIRDRIYAVINERRMDVAVAMTRTYLASPDALPSMSRIEHGRPVKAGKCQLCCDKHDGPRVSKQRVSRLPHQAAVAQRARELYANGLGLPIRRIAMELDASETTIRRWVLAG